MFNKILYVGAGTHLEVMNDFSDTKNFVLLDSRPRNEYGYDYYYRGFYRESFLPELYAKLIKMDFKVMKKTVLTDNYSEILVKDLDSSLIQTKRDECLLRYYYSTGLPDNIYNNPSLQKDIAECDTVLVSGHYPHESILEFLPKTFHFIGYTSTYFPKNLKDFLKERNEQISIIPTILKEQNKTILSYTLVNRESGKKQTFETYGDFYKALQKEKSKNKDEE